MAVVDKEDRLLGMITVYDIVDIIEQENIKDIRLSISGSMTNSNSFKRLNASTEMD